MKKKLLILSGADVHKRVIETAKSMGVHTIVTDYIKDSPSKTVADESWDISISEVDEIVKKCRQEKVDGVINLLIDPGQIPYYEICEKLGCYCYGTREQFEVLTNKDKFKECCIKNEIPVIEGFTPEDVAGRRVDFPVFVKPTNSRGSRGQSICNSYEELSEAIEFARSESDDEGVLIEKYMSNRCSFQVTYFCANGNVSLIRTADGYKGSVSDNIDRVAQYSVSPSIHTDEYLQVMNDRVVRFIKSLGIINGPVLFQGFYDNGIFRLYDPGFRFPGTDYEIIIKKMFNIDLIRSMILFSLTGEMPDDVLTKDVINLNGQKGLILFPTLREGKIAHISGIDELCEREDVLSAFFQYGVGDIITSSNTTRQRLGQIVVLTDEEVETVIDDIYDTLIVNDENGNSMIIKLNE